MYNQNNQEMYHQNNQEMMYNQNNQYAQDVKNIKPKERNERVLIILNNKRLLIKIETMLKKHT